MNRKYKNLTNEIINLRASVKIEEPKKLSLVDQIKQRYANEKIRNSAWERQEAREGILVYTE